MKTKGKFGIIRTIILIIWVICCIFPIYWTLITSFKAQVDIYGGPY